MNTLTLQTPAMKEPSHNRKYSAIWNILKEKHKAEIKCKLLDANTIINGVRREKVKDKTKENGKILNFEYILGEQKEFIGVRFLLVEDISIRNL